MSNLLEEYKAYYKVRVQKYEDNPKYINSYRAEKELSDTIQSCQSIEDFKEKMGNKNELCAIALVKDESIIENDFYNEYKEEIRQLASKRILSQIDHLTNSQDVISLVVDEDNKNSIEISMDESNLQLLHDWHLLEDYEIYLKANVPDKYKNDLKITAENSKKALLRNILDLEQNNKVWENNWKISPKIALKERFVNLFPYKQEHVKEQIDKYIELIN